MPFVVVSRAVMDAETQKRFTKLWNTRPKIRLEDIASQLGY